MKFEIDEKLNLLKIDGEAKYRLTYKERKLLKIFINKPNYTFLTADLAEMIESKRNSIKSLISKIKIDYPEVVPYLRTIWGIGYEWRQEGENDNES